MLEATTYLGSECGVGVVQTSRDLVLLSHVLHLSNQRHDGLVFLVSLTQCCLELVVCINQPLNLLNGVNYKHVHQVFTCSIQPIVERLKCSNKTLMHMRLNNCNNHTVI